MSLTKFPNGIDTGSLVINNNTVNAGAMQVVTASATFDGGTENARGDEDGTSNPTTVFEVSGVALVTVFAVPSEDLEGASATLELGVAGNTAALIAQTTATNIDDGDIWADASPAAGAYTANDPIIVADDIIETVGTANITGGALTYYCIWWPVSDGATVTEA